MKRVTLGLLFFVGLPLAFISISGLGLQWLTPHLETLEVLAVETRSKIQSVYLTIFENERDVTQACTVGDTINVDAVKLAVDQELNMNKIPLEFADVNYNADKILSDPLNRVSEDFKISPDLRRRVAFWFDIYTRYSARFSVIHDIDRPWIIYKVVDVRPIYDEPINIFQKDIKERRAIANAEAAVRKALLALSRKRNLFSLSDEEAKYVELFKDIPGNKRAIFKKAAYNFRAQKGQKNFMRQGIAWSAKYINEMEAIFARYDLPVELVRLPLVESSFNEDATSKVGASGIWQFMHNTGKMYLKVNDTIDERNSPLKATEAAAQLMLSNFRILKTWPFAVTAYNHGAGGLIQASKKFQTQNLAEIIEKHHARSFGFASENFFSEFLAALHSEKYQEEIFGLIPKHEPLSAEDSVLKYNIRVGTLADLLGLTLEEIKLYNPDLKSRNVTMRTTLPQRYRIRLPTGRKTRLELYYQRADENRRSKRVASREG